MLKIYKNDELPQGSEAWLRTRLGKLTASKANAISVAGKGLETLCLELATEKFTQVLPEQYTNADIERGNAQEETARQFYSMDAGVDVEEVGFGELSEYVGASPDGLVGDDGMVEFKCPNDKSFAQLIIFGPEKISKDYIMQMQMQMYVFDRKWCDFCAYNENFRELSMFKHRVERDEDLIEKIVAGLEKGEAMIKEWFEKMENTANA